MLNFLIDSHTSSSVAKLDDYIPFTLWSNVLVSDHVVVCSASLYVRLLLMYMLFSCVFVDEGFDENVRLSEESLIRGSFF